MITSHDRYASMPITLFELMSDSSKSLVESSVSLNLLNAALTSAVENDVFFLLELAAVLSEVCSPCFSPQEGQNFAPSSSSAPHLVHFAMIKYLYIIFCGDM